MLLSDSEALTEVNCDIKLIQNKNGLTYGTDAFLLAAFMRETKGLVGVEYGSGSGIISLLLAKKNKLKHIHSLEIQPYYAELTKRNILLNNLGDKVTAHNIDIRHFEGEYDVVFTNPPYMKADGGKRNSDNGKFMARHEACGDIYDFCSAASKNLKYGGLFYCVYRPDRLIDLFSAMRGAAIEPKCICFVHASARHKPSLVLVEGKRGGKPSCDIMRPLILSDGEGGESCDCKEIYSNLSWYGRD